MDFTYLFRVLLKKKWLIIGASVLATLVAYFFTRNQEKKYRSVAQVSTGFTISDEIKVGNENFSFYEADTKFNNAIVTATSPSVISLLSYTLMLHDLQDPRPFTYLSPEKRNSALNQEVDKQKAIHTLQGKLETMSMLTSFNPDEKKLLELLKLYGYDYRTLNNNLNVFRLQRTDYIQIEYISANPELSAFIVNSAFQQFLRYYKSVRSDKSMESIDTLQSLLEKKKQVLDEKNKALQSEGISQAGVENSSKLELIMNLETTLTEEKNKQTNLSFEILKIDQRLNAGGKSSGSSTTPSTRNNEDLLTLRQAMYDAQTAYSNSNNDPVLLKRYNQAKLDYQNKVIASTQESTSGSTSIDAAAPELSRTQLLNKKADLELDIKASAANIESIQGKINTLRNGLALDASKEAQVQTLLNDATLANKEYVEAKQKYNDAMDISSASITNFRQILHGQPAIEPEPSKRMLIVGMAGVSVFIISLLIIILLAYMDSSIKTPEIFARTVNLKLMGMVNFMNLRQKSLADLVVSKDQNIDLQDRNKLNVFRESLRKLRYEIEMSGKKIFLFTSTKKGEGKTTLIQALSYSLSMSKKKILIIDTNFCNNDLTVQLNADPILEKIHPNQNESSYRTLLDQVRNAAKDVGPTGVYAIGSHGGDYTPSEILPRENLLKHLQSLTAEYDYIFLEGPPLNDFSDSKELAQFVDGIIAIFSATNIIKQIDKQSMGFFRDLNGKFTGAILNKVDIQNVNVS